MDVIIIIVIWLVVSFMTYSAGYDDGKRFAYKNTCPFNKNNEEAK